jgi:kynurenine formamidase
VSRPAEFDELSVRVRNWGRWGADDELGTLNLITPARRVASAALVQRGAAFSLCLPFQDDGPQLAALGRINPLHFMLATGADPQQPFDLGGGCRYTDDFVSMPLQAGTQWDSLAHVYYDDRLYNDYPASSVDSYGAHRNAIDNAREVVVTRGVLLDIPRLRGVPWLREDDVVSTEDLLAAEDAAGLTVGEGDIVLVRVGLGAARAASGTWDAYRTDDMAGVEWRTAAWFHERGVAAVAADNREFESPWGLPGMRVPFHMLALRDMGMPIGELWDLEALAADCAADGVHEFMLVAPALPFTRAVGSPVNPIAVK